MKTSTIKALIAALSGLLTSKSAGYNSVSKQERLSFVPSSVCENPFKLLPNTSSLVVSVSRLDPLLSKGGIVKKLAPKMHFAELSHKLKAANRYLRIMHWKLCFFLHTGQFIEFWVLALNLMSRSRVLRAAALRKLDRNWHRNFKFSYVKSLLAQLGSMLQEVPVSLLIKRRYEPKAGGKWRPIGSPERAARMYFYIWQCFIVMALNSHINKSQHAYRPKQGVVTALAELKPLLKSKFLWEFDLKGAFPSVSVSKTCRALVEVGFPVLIAAYLEESAIATVERVDLRPVGEPVRTPEPKFEKQVMLGPALNFIHNVGAADFEFGWNSVQQQFIDTVAWAFNRNPKDPELIKYCMGHTAFPKEDIKVTKIVNSLYPSQPDVFTSAKAALHRILHGAMLAEKADMLPVEVRGFPQGAGTSPILFNFAFEMFAWRAHFSKLHPSVKIVSYADDFIIASDVDLPGIWQLPDNGSGLQISVEKSRVLRRDGINVEKSVKFLGVTFHLDSGLIEGTPRSGTNLSFTKDSVVRDFHYRDMQLVKFGNYFKDLLGKVSPQAILNSWGADESPANLLPVEVIQGEAPVSNSLLRQIRSQVSEGSTSPVSSSGPPDFSASLMERMKSAPDWLKTRLAGLFTSRLHSGSWLVTQPSADRSLLPKPETEGRSWIDLKQNSVPEQTQRILDMKAAASSLKSLWAKGDLDEISSRLALINDSIAQFRRELSIYNSTSHATLDSLNLLSPNKSVKVSKKRIRIR